MARHLEYIGTAKAISYSMVAMSILFWCLGYIFDMAALIHLPTESTIVGLLIVMMFFMGAFFSTITTSYYSLATIFVANESAMSSIEAAVGSGYILGPILGSMIYGKMLYRYAYTFISLVMMVTAFVTWKILAPYLKYKQPEVADGDGLSPDLEAQTSFGQQQLVQLPSTISLLKHRTILFSATTIMWINVAWTCVEPILAKRLENTFQVGKEGIGVIFSLSNIVYVPTVFLARYLPRRESYTGRHQIISLSAMLTPIAVLLVGSPTFSLVVMGITLLGLLPTPVWVLLLPFMQIESLRLFPDPSVKRCVNDLTAGIYNSFMTFGQILGYLIGPLLGSYGFAATTQMVALIIFLQSLLFHFGTTERFKPRRKKDYIQLMN